jgi:lipoprotein-releasing system permease protein
MFPDYTGKKRDVRRYEAELISFPLFISKRYLFSKKGFKLINIINLMSTLGIIIGVSALICVMSIFNGFREIAKNQIIGFDPHLRITISNEMVPDQNIILEKIRAVGEVKSVYPVIQGRLVAYKGQSMQVFPIYALPKEYKSQIPGLRSSMLFGRPFNKSTSNNDIIVGASMGNSLGLLPGDTVQLVTPAMLRNTLTMYIPYSPVRSGVSGVYQSNQVFDSYAYCSYELGEKLFPGNNIASRYIDIRLKNSDNVDEARKSILKFLPQGTKIESWEEINKELYKVLNFERLSTFTILSLILVIAVFNILASLSMTVVEKRSNIALMKAFGARDSHIRMIFVYQGIIVGIFGTLLGLIAGLALCYGQIEYSWFQLDTAKYIVSAIPVRIDPTGVALVCLISVAMSLLATLWPSYRAAKSALAPSLRYE